MILSRSDFVNFSGIKNTQVSIYLRRGNIVQNKDGTFDTENEVNREFLKRRAAQGKTPQGTAAVVGVNAVEKQTPKEPTQRKAAPVITQPELSEKSKKKIEKSTVSRFELELEKLRAEIDKKYIDTELAQEKLATLKGDNVPVALVKDIIARLSKSIITNYKTFSDQQIAEIAHKYKIPEKERVKLSDNNLKGLNRIHNKAILEAKNDFKNELGEFKVKESLSNNE